LTHLATIARHPTWSGSVHATPRPSAPLDYFVRRPPDLRNWVCRPIGNQTRNIFAIFLAAACRSGRDRTDASVSLAFYWAHMRLPVQRRI